MMNIVNAAWIPELGIHFHLAADGISVVLVLLTGIAALAGVLFSWNIEERAPEFFALYFTLIAGVYGVFLSFDLFLLFVFYELAIVPKYFLIAIWGSTRREYGAMKLALYSFGGTALVLIGLIAAYVVSGGTTLELVELARYPFPAAFQVWAFPLVFLGFAILAGIWPFHTWAPTGHVAAPTAASMLLAGVVMKLGAYGALRVAMTLFPLGLRAWRNEIALLAVIGIVYGALAALVQKDFKFVIGYSSVSHMGFVLLGPHDLRPRSYARPGSAATAQLEQASAVCRRDVCDRGRGLDGLAGLQRIHRGTSGPGGGVASVSAFDSPGRSRDRHRRRLHFAGVDKGFLCTRQLASH
jgi:NADH-quinone oxidoreductase subunit M